MAAFMKVLLGTGLVTVVTFAFLYLNGVVDYFSSPSFFHARTYYTATSRRVVMTNTRHIVVKEQHNRSHEKPLSPTSSKKQYAPFVILIPPKLTTKQIELHKLTMPLPWSARCKQPKFAVVIVESAPANLDRRNTIRQTWQNMFVPRGSKISVSDKGFQFDVTDIIKIVFLLGKTESNTEMEKLKSEAAEHEDIVIGSFKDSYNNLTMKTILGLKWTHFFCSASYLVKTDDDVFVNTVGLVEWLQGSPRLNFYSGYCNSHSPAIRDQNSKWYVSEEQYAGSKYPPYCLGGGYVMSKDVLTTVVGQCFTTPLFPMEDLHVGLIIHSLPGVHLVDERKRFQLAYRFSNNPCHLKKLIIAHQVTIPMQTTMMGLYIRSETECR